jgi:hypothetical protein
MEYAETRYAQQSKQEYRIKYPQGIGKKYGCIIEYPECDDTTEHYNCEVNKKDTPVWQRILREVPVQYLIKWIPHISSLLKNRCKGTNKCAKNKTILSFF